MTEEKIIQDLLRLGFRDLSDINEVKFMLDINNFELFYINGKLELQGDGGYDEAGNLDLSHLQISQIKPLYNLLTGEDIVEKEVVFNYSEWQEKLKKDEVDRIEWRKQFLLDNPIYAKFPTTKDIGFLAHLGKDTSVIDTGKIVWHEQSFIKEDNK